MGEKFGFSLYYLFLFICHSFQNRTVCRSSPARLSGHIMSIHLGMMKPIKAAVYLQGSDQKCICSVTIVVPA